MAEHSEISWTHATFNPWAGCTKVSPACDNCYAEIDTKRRGFVEWGKDATRRVTSDGYWKQPFKWDWEAYKAKERRRVFCGSWCDVMEDRDELQPVRERLYDVIRGTPNLDWLLLTKRPQNFRRFLPAEWLVKPMPNVWGMTTVETPTYLWRAEELRKTPFAVRGLSMEPLLAAFSPLDLDLRGIHWVIVGGESQKGARAMHPRWARDIRDHCVANGVAFHFKQFGEHNADLIRIGKKTAGRVLDGRTWDEIPTVGQNADAVTR